MPAFEPSLQQSAIFQNIATGLGHTCVIARAGAGKTSTILEGLRYLPRDVARDCLLVAFNKNIADELKQKAPPGVTVQTLHSYGFSQIRAAMQSEVKVDAEKLRKIVKTITPVLEDQSAICKLVSLAKNLLIKKPARIEALFDEYGIPGDIEIRPVLVDQALQALAECKQNQSVIDYDDMIWFPNVFDMGANFTYARVFVDEMQDLNRAQVSLIDAAIDSEGRLCGIGDPAQAIYQFRGAGTDVIGKFVRDYEAVTLPLTTTYRCARRIVEEARRLVPDFQAAPNAPDGVVETLDEAGPWLSLVRPGDFVLSRVNAPLVSLFFSLVRSGKRARIQGRDIGGRIVALVRRLRAGSISELTSRVMAWREREVARLADAGKTDSWVADTAGLVLAFCEECVSVGALLKRVEEVFSDDNGGPGQIVLSSTHKAKGLERDRVFLLRDTYMQNRYRKDPATGTWVTEPPDDAERNLLYVAISRARRELYYVRDLEG